MTFRAKDEKPEMPNSLPIYSVQTKMEASLIITKAGVMGPNLHWYLTMNDGELFSGEFEDLEPAGDRLATVHQSFGGNHATN